MFTHCSVTRRFIKYFASIAHPLHDLTKKDTPWKWAEEQQNAFNTLKEVFCQEPILKVYDPNLPTRVEVDASGFATDRILSQKYPYDLWHPIAYCSGSMSKEEHNYEIYDREMLGLICTLEDWRHFLEGISLKLSQTTKTWSGGQLCTTSIKSKQGGPCTLVYLPF